MKFVFVLLFILEIVCWKSVKSLPTDGKEVSKKAANFQSVDNVLTDEIKDEDKSTRVRFQRDLKNRNNDETSIRFAYERAMNQTRSDYYAQRQAIMERYYARQREIIDRFGGKTTTPSTGSTTSITNGKKWTIIDGDTTTAAPLEGSTVSSKSQKEKNNNNQMERSTEDYGNKDERNDNSTSLIYRFNNWNPKVIENATDINIQAESSNTVTSSVDKTKIPGYYKLGEFKGSKDEKIVYQHNLGVGLKGSSQLEANFEVILDGVAITVIEAFPYADTRAHFSWISGGPGGNSAKLKLKGYENEGFSYTVQVWGVPVSN